MTFFWSSMCPLSPQDSKPTKKSKKDVEAETTKPAPAKKPRGKKAPETGDAKKSPSPSPVKPKAVKTSKEPKAGGTTKSKAAKARSNAPPAAKIGKGGKKTAD